jgi:hypothetical protein
VFFLERTLGHICVVPSFASSAGGPGPVSLSQRLNSQPRRVTLAYFGPFLTPRKSPNSGQESPAPVASTGGRSGHFRNPLEATGGTQTHSRRTGSKLGRLHRARQGLVRVPESSTKYGGKRGKPRGQASPWMLPSISESSEIPKRKNCFQGQRFSTAPAVHRATIYCGQGVAPGRLR